jgi:quercetin dioxygenase-like cupin family protein
MLDRLVREVPLAGGEPETIDPERIAGLLREATQGILDSDTSDEAARKLDRNTRDAEEPERYVFRCVDGVLHHLHRIGHFVNIRLVRPEDVAPQVEYYVRLLAKHKQIYAKYIKAVGYGEVLQYFEGFRPWRDASPGGTEMYEFPDLIRRLPRADIPIKGLKAHLLQGEDRQVLFMVFQLDAQVPPHSHGGQWGTVLDGRIDLTVSGVRHTYTKGDSYYIPEGIEHSAVVHAGYADVTVFEDRDRYAVLE